MAGRSPPARWSAIVPLAVLNHWLILSGIPDPLADEQTTTAFYWLMILVMIEAPLATAPFTLYLGQALFVEKPPARRDRARILFLPAATGAVASDSADPVHPARR